MGKLKINIPGVKKLKKVTKPVESVVSIVHKKDDKKDWVAELKAEIAKLADARPVFDTEIAKRLLAIIPEED